MVTLDKKIQEDENKLYTERAYQQEFLQSYNSPAHKLAARSIQLITLERSGSASPLITHLVSAVYRSPAKNSDVKTDTELWFECTEIWENEVLKPLADLAYAMRARILPTSATCAEIDAATNEYMAKEAAIRKAGTLKIKKLVQQSSAAFDQWIKLNVYGLKDDLPKNPGEKLKELISQMDFTIRRKRYKDGQVYNFLNKANTIVQNQTYVKSACDNSEAIERLLGEDHLEPLVPSHVKCEFIKNINTPVVTWSLECNIIKEKAKRNMKKRMTRFQGVRGKAVPEEMDQGRHWVVEEAHRISPSTVKL